MLRRLMCPLAAVDRHQQSHHLRRHFVGNFQTFPKCESDQGLNGPCNRCCASGKRGFSLSMTIVPADLTLRSESLFRLRRCNDQEQPCNQSPALALEMEAWTLVAELTKPLYGHHGIPALIGLRIVVSFYLRHMDDPDDTLRVLIADLNAALAQKPMRAN
jgi:hypothetical protein